MSKSFHRDSRSHQWNAPTLLLISCLTNWSSKRSIPWLVKQFINWVTLDVWNWASATVYYWRHVSFKMQQNSFQYSNSDQESYTTNAIKKRSILSPRLWNSNPVKHWWCTCKSLVGHVYEDVNIFCCEIKDKIGVKLLSRWKKEIKLVYYFVVYRIP